MQDKSKNNPVKPELLLPAGNMENFKAAIVGGADAVYLGIKQFNARGRAQNFSWQELATALEIGRQYKVKVYVTLNTVIKNTEIEDLIETLHHLNQLRPDALIIQDWGVYYIVKKYFPKLKVHASTQMGNHNHLGTSHAKKLDFQRVILARELTMPELERITQNTEVQTEVFIHGALCYSFSGMCLFSSFTGGQGANRGLCKQPCRRIFHTPQKSTPFSLKDLQSENNIEQLKQLNIHSLKIEGRLKSANYVFNVAKAYKILLNDPSKRNEALKLLEMDMGRDKTGYFAGGDVSGAITSRTATGYNLGHIIKNDTEYLTIHTSTKLEKGDRLRIVHQDGTQTAFKINKHKAIDNGYSILKTARGKFAKGDKVFLASQKEKKIKSIDVPAAEFSSKPISKKNKAQVADEIKDKKRKKTTNNRDNIYVRINDLDWIKKVQFNDIEGLLLKLPLKQYGQLRTEVPFIKKNLHKIIIELPAFIPEDGISKWKELINNLKNKGIKKFALSHLSQQLFFNPKDFLMTNEQVYAFNDAAIHVFKTEKINKYTLPFENDMDNIKSYSFSDGIIPVYFRPPLFFSRMPVKIDSRKPVFDDYNPNMQLNYIKRDNLNYIYPEQPVSFTHQVNEFRKQGFNNFLVDFSFEKPSQNRWKTVLKRVKFSEQIQPAYSFNLKNGLV
ncbi:putative protease YhbU precursor [Salinivirga cyanobacteriivorans]|uniref:Putative protease YhbU n=1 Tax=Salinivirga cyanobacteriivorans TaxID=1307839 RepID=A0A0S2HVT4_9BACT|nr:peptidase U32 family protein [Salinivirga cyanobacteriivorans]ALO14146.1 putative protease YhbU precursor [Salinivirga cyanobacteriivorans]